MSHRRLFSRPRLAAPLLALALALLSFASACAQRQGGSGAAAATPPQAEIDSIGPRADRARREGSDSAKVLIIEVSDFQCPYCHQFFENTYHKLDSAYIKTGRVAMLYINYPLPGHPQAFAAAKTAMCAGAQGKFWQMHDRLFSGQRDWSQQPDAAQRFARYAVDLGLDTRAFRDCVDNDRTAGLIVNDVMQVAQAGIRGTPTFILNGRKTLDGAQPFEVFAREIDALLANPNAGAPAPPAVPPTPR